MVSELKKKDEIIAEKNKQIESYSNLIDENKNLKEKLAQYEELKVR